MDIVKTLYALGITPRYKGYEQLLYAVTLVPRPIMEIYKETAEHLGCTASSVDRNIRSLIKRAWKMNPELICEMIGAPLPTAPTVGWFIELLAAQCLSDDQKSI